MFLRICLLLLCLELIGLRQVSGKELMCYFCSDTSSEDNDNDCQNWYRTMKYYRKRFEDTKKYSTEKYVKNCTDYGMKEDGTQPDVSCMIASIRQGGNVKSYIRDCSTGSQFFTEEINKQFDDSIVTKDNQTTCIYSGQGYVACVTLCGSNMGGSNMYQQFNYENFCNGPVLTAGAETLSFISLMTVNLMTLVFIRLL